VLENETDGVAEGEDVDEKDGNGVADAEKVDTADGEGVSDGFLDRLGRLDGIGGLEHLRPLGPPHLAFSSLQSSS
jgi:hypothetical protein